MATRTRIPKTDLTDLDLALVGLFEVLGDGLSTDGREHASAITRRRIRVNTARNRLRAVRR
jgi:hypothetical protein